MRATGHPAQANLRLLEQAAGLLRRLNPRLFRAASDRLPGGTAGAHVRHCLDFYDSFLRGLPDGKIDYDRRERSRRVETDPTAALVALRGVIDGLTSLRPEEMAREVLVRGDAAEDEPGWSRSSVARELAYLSSHTTHHYAIIGSILREHGFDPDPDFGVAPSTLLHWKATGARP
jgi:hypothetical protein